MSAQCVYVRDVSVVSPYALLMFGGDISIQHQHQLVSIDSFITLKVILLPLLLLFITAAAANTRWVTN